MGVDLVPDERLVARVRAGDMRAFEAIYDRYERPIRIFCRHLLGQPEDADDAVQHTFLAAYRTITGSDQRLDLKPWLFTVARNRCRSLLRSRRRDPCVTGEAFEPSTEGLAAAVERRESLRHMLADIAALPEEQRAALILTQLETLKHDQVARVLEVPTDKVKALVFQARTSLMHAREARDTACGDIREQLSTLSGPALRRGNLKRHLRMCTGCRDFEVGLRQQHGVILLLLPVAAHPALRTKVLGEIAGGGSGAAAAGGAGASGLFAKGAAIKLASVAAVTVAGAGVVVAGPGTVAAVAGDAFHGERGGGAVAAAPLQAGVDPATGARAIALRTADRSKHRLVSAPQSPGGPFIPPEHNSAQRLSSGSHVHDSPGGPTPTNSSGGAASPPGLAKQGGTPPDLAKQGGTPPGLAKQGGTPPGLAKQGGTPPGLAKQGGTPPGLAKQGGTPPGQSKKQGFGAPDSTPPGQAKTPPGQAKKMPPAVDPSPAPTTTGAPAPGNGNGSGNSSGVGNGNGHGSGHGGGSRSRPGTSGTG
jgi:RNA polymerase sigma factor (sigma-70 family)